jgi:lipoate-protein ligase A
VANQFIMRRNRAAIEPEVRSQKSEVRVAIRGHTDLAIGEKKFSGNSQRRRKHFLLFHGTFLLNFDLALIGDLLRMPSKEPDYRENRKHADFLTNINASAEKVKAALAKEWNTIQEFKDPPLEEISKLAREKYSMREWNYKF